MWLSLHCFTGGLLACGYHATWTGAGPDGIS
jgi:hypothetical protein